MERTEAIRGVSDNRRRHGKLTQRSTHTREQNQINHSLETKNSQNSINSIETNIRPSNLKRPNLTG